MISLYLTSTFWLTTLLSIRYSPSWMPDVPWQDTGIESGNVVVNRYALAGYRNRIFKLFRRALAGYRNRVQKIVVNRFALAGYRNRIFKLFRRALAGYRNRVW